MRWKALAILTFARCAMGFQFQSIAAIAPLMTNSLGINKAEFGWLIGLFLLPGVAVALPGGMIAARFGDKRVVLVAFAFMFVGGIEISISDTFVAAAVGRLLCGVGAAILNVVMAKMVADWFETKERALAMAVLVSSFPIGIGFALLSIGPLSDLINWRLASGSSAVFCAAGFIAVLSMYPSQRRPTNLSPRSSLTMLSLQDCTILLLASLPWALYNAAYQIMISFLPSFLSERGLNVVGAGFASAMNTAAFIFSIQLGGMILRITKHRDTVCAAAIVLWCAALLQATRSTSPVGWVILAGALAGIPAGGFLVLPTEVLHANKRAVGMGVFFTVYYIACAILPGLAGLLSDKSGGASGALSLSTLLALICIPVVLLFRRLSLLSSRTRGQEGY